MDDLEIEVGFVRTAFDTNTGPDTATLADETTTGVWFLATDEEPHAVAPDRLREASRSGLPLRA